jgi:hypothetical protein
MPTPSPRRLLHAGLLFLAGLVLGAGAAAAQPAGSVRDPRVDVPLTLPAGAFTVEAWVNPRVHEGAGFAPALMIGSDGTHFITLGITRGAGLVFVDGIVSGGTAPAGTWTHIAYVWDGTASRLFVNGTQTAAMNRAPSTVRGPLTVGAFNGSIASYHPWDGLIDEVMVWGGARSAAQIARDGAHGLRYPETQPGLLAYYRFGEAAGAAVTNAVASGPNGALVAGTRAAENAPLTPFPTTGPLFGDYAVPGDFATPAEAVAAVNTRGVSDAVRFNLAPGTYTLAAPLTITAGETVGGTSTARTVTLRSRTGQAADVTLGYAATGDATNGVVILDGADHVALEDLTLRALNPALPHAVWLKNGAAGNRISRCVLDGGPLTTSSGGVHALVYGQGTGLLDTVVEGSTLRGGGTGVSLTGATASSSGTRIEGNVFRVGHEAVYLASMHSPALLRNRVEGGVRGFELTSTKGVLRVEGNRARVAGEPLTISSHARDTARPSDPRALVANNVLVQEGPHGNGVMISGEDLDVVHNSVLLRSGTSVALSLNGVRMGARNNVVAALGGGAAVRVSVPGVTGDGNALLGVGLFLAQGDNGTPYTALADFAAVTGWTHTVEADPVFDAAALLAGELRTRSPWLATGGTPDPRVTTDLDGAARSGPRVSLGAYEFATPLVPMAGSYTVPGHFPTLADALVALRERGVSGPTELLLGDAVYAEGALTLDAVAGAGATRSVTIRGAGVTPVLRHTAGADDNWLLRLRRPRHVAVRGLAFEPQSPSYTRSLLITGRVDSVAVTDNAFTAPASLQPHSPHVEAKQIAGRGLRVAGNTFTGATGAVEIAGYDNGWAGYLRYEGVEVEGNTATGFRSRGVSVLNAVAPVVAGNTLTTTTGSEAVLISNVRGGFRVERNRLAATSQVLVVTGSSGTPAAPNLIANNAIGGTAGSGIRYENTDYTRIVHNSIGLTNTFAGQALWMTASAITGVEVRNNVLAFFGPGAAYSISATALNGGTVFDHNALYTQGGALARRGNTGAATVEAVRALYAADAAGMEAHSLSVFPGFDDLNGLDLSTVSPFLDGAGADAGVAVDIDGASRAAHTPYDIGAFAVVAPVEGLAGDYTINPGLPSDLLAGGRNTASFEAAVFALRTIGVTGPVRFRVAAGTYDGRLTLPAFPGMGAARRVTFESATGVAADVTLRATSGNTDSYLVKLDGADAVTLRALSFSTGGYPRAVWVAGDADGVRVEQSVFATTSGSHSGSLTYALLVADGSAGGGGFSGDDLTVVTSTFAGATAGVYVTGTDAVQPAGVVVYGNTFTLANAVYFQKLTAPQASHNRIHATSTGIELADVASTSPGALVANNAVVTDGSSNAAAIRLTRSAGVRVWHNAVASRAVGATATALHVAGGGAALDVRNNVFATYAQHAGVPVHLDGAALASAAYDHNAYRAPAGRPVGRIGTTAYATLADWQGALGTSIAGAEAHALAVDPQFANADALDLTPTNAALLAAGAALDLATDLNGSARPLPAGTAPDVGAVEINQQAGHLVVAAPAAGATFRLGSAVPITWHLTGLDGAVALHLLAPGGAATGLATVAGADGAWTWTVPTTLAPGAGYRIAVTSTADAAVADTSGAFTLEAPPAFAVTSPAPLDAYLPAAQVRIRWTSPPSMAGNVRVEILNAAGAVVRVTHASTDDTGSKNTTLNAATPPGAGYRFRVTSLADNAVVGLSAPFTVLDPAFAVAVTAPAAGARIPFGETQQVTWASPPALPATAMLGVWLVRGSDPALRRRLRREANDGQASVRLPSDVPAADDYRLELVAESDGRYGGRTAPFALGAFTAIASVTPGAGATWAAGSTQPITWAGTALDSAATVRIFLLRPGLPKLRLAVTTAGSATGGTWAWALPAELAPGGGYQIQVDYADAAGQAIKAKSAAFAVSAGLALAHATASGLPTAYALEAAYPNPFRERAAIRYALPAAGEAHVEVYDVTGRRVAVLAEGAHVAGRHEAVLDGSSLASGVYVVRVVTDGGAFVARLTLAR